MSLIWISPFGTRIVSSSVFILDFGHGPYLCELIVGLLLSDIKLTPSDMEIVQILKASKEKMRNVI